MPLADDGGVVAGPTQGLAPQWGFLGTPLGVERSEPCVQHGAAGYAHGSAPRALVEAVGEGAAAAHQAVEMGRTDLIVAECTDATVGQIVGDQKQEIWMLYMNLRGPSGH